MKGSRGGARKGGGRKPKSDEQALMEKLSPYDDLACQKLIEGVRKGNFFFIRMFFEYRIGKPKQQVDVTSGGELISPTIQLLPLNET